MARPKAEKITSQRIAALAKERRLSQKLLAEKMNVAPVTIHRWMSGKSYVDNKYLSELAGVLGTTSDYLRGHTDARTHEEQMKEAERCGVDFDCEYDGNKEKQRKTIRSRFFETELGFTYEEDRIADCASDFNDFISDSDNKARPYILKDRNGGKYSFSPEEFSMLMHQISIDIITFACNRKEGGNTEVR